VTETSPAQPALSAPRRILLAITSRVRRVLAGMFQIVFRDQLAEISRQTQQLGSASVESATHLGAEMRRIDQRLARIESELAELRGSRRAG
jgi:hypothetical protein